MSNPIAKLNSPTTLVGGKGLILGPGAPTVFAEGFVVSTLGDQVAPHGEPPHTKATVIGASTVIAMGRPVVKNGDVATCGDTVISASTILVR